MTAEALLDRTIELNRVTGDRKITKKFNEWIEEKGYMNYDSIETWILLPKYTVLTTKQLYIEFVKQNLAI